MWLWWRGRHVEVLFRKKHTSFDIHGLIVLYLYIQQLCSVSSPVKPSKKQFRGSGLTKIRMIYLYNFNVAVNRKCVSTNFHLFQWGQFLRVSPLISFSVNFIVSHNITFHGKPINPTHNSIQFLGISRTPKTKHAQAGLQALVQALWQRCTQ